MLTQAEESYYKNGGTPLTQEPQNSQGPQNSGERVNGVLDVGRGIAYGATEAFRSIYNLVNVLDDKTINVMEPRQDPFVNAPETFIGQLAGGATQFFLPFGLFTKGASAIAGLGLVAKAPKIQGAISWFAGAKTGKALEELADAAGRGGALAGWGKLTASAVSTGSVASRAFLSDFVAFEGAGHRLSEIVQANPTFANPLTEFLAGDEDDSELMGRFKNALEGFGLGLGIDTLVAWRRGAKGAKVVREAGGTQEEIAEAFVRGTDESLQATAAKVAAERDTALGVGLDDTTGYKRADGTIIEETVKEKLDKLYTFINEFMDAGKIGKKAGEIVEDYDVPNLEGNPKLWAASDLKELGIDIDADNLAYLTNGNGMMALNRAIEIEGHARGKGTVVPNAETFAKAVAKTAELAGLGIDDSRALIAKLSGETADNVRAAMLQVQTFRMVSVVMADKMFPLIRDLMKKPQHTWEDNRAAVDALSSFMHLQNGIRAVTSEFGRALQSVSIKIDGDVVRKSLDEDFTFKPLDAMRSWNEDTFNPVLGQKLINDGLKIFNSPNPFDNIKTLDAWNKMPLHRKIMTGAVEYFINALLSSPATHVVNTASGVSMGYFRSVERWASAHIGGVFGDAEEKLMARAMAEGEMGTIQNLYSDMVESFHAARQSGTSPFVVNTPFDKGQMSALTNAGAETMFEPLIRGIQLPSRALTREDVGIKNWVGRSRFRAVYRNELAQMGVHPSEIPARIEEGLKAVYRSNGNIREHTALARAFKKAEMNGTQQELLPDAAARLLNLNDESLDALLRSNDDAVLRAKEVTWSTELGQVGLGYAGRLTQRLQKKHPLTQLFMPFVRTPVNIAEYGWDRSVGAVLGTGMEMLRHGANLIPGIDIKRTTESMFKLQRQLASPDAATRIEARGKIAYGLALIGGIAGSLSVDRGEGDLPLVTGSGPSDPAELEALKLSGWQPFSIKFGDKYISYSRLDPFATLIGITVDAAEFIREAEDEDDRNMAVAVMQGLAVSAANNVTKKTYFQGLQNVLAALTNPDEEVPRLFNQTAAAFIPGIVAGIERTVDPEVEEARGIMDKLMSRIPGFSTNVDKRRNILGETISIEGAAGATFNPFRISTVSDSVVDKEISKFSYGFRMPGTRRDGLDLLDEQFRMGKRSAFDAWVERSGKIKIQGQDLRQALRREIKTANYQRLSDKDGPNGEVSPRVSVINAVIRRYRAAAWRDILKDNPALAAEARRVKTEGQQFKKGVIQFPVGN